jgi:DNA polymerase (family X)
VQNARVAECLEHVADLLDLKGDSEFRIRSYRNAARTIRDLTEPVEELDDKGLAALPYIGKATVQKIREILATGTCARLQELLATVPNEVVELMRVPGLGPRKAMLLHEELGIGSLAALEKACQEERVRELPHMGEKTEEKILGGLRTLRADSGRILLKEASDRVAALGKHLAKLDAIERWEVAGSYRRGRDTIGDLDVLVLASDREAATDGIIAFREIEEVTSKGHERVSVRLDAGFNVDFRFFDEAAFGAAMLYFTGSKAHNIALRKRAIDAELKLNEYGLFRGKKRVAGMNEVEVYAALDLPWIPPELREDRGEIDAAEGDALPALVELGDIRGDLHCHTKLTDGAHTLEQMAEAARARGYAYLAVTEHTKSLAMTKGLDSRRALQNAKRIRDLAGKLGDIWLLAGIECDILADGALDLDSGVLSELDWVVASVHSHFDQSAAKMTKRLVKAIASGVVNAIGHPTGRLLGGKRDPVRFDADEVLAACKEHRVALEVNAQPDRLDLPDRLCQRARELGLAFVISSDAHKTSDFDFMQFGVTTARRGWLEKRDVLNTLTAAALRKRLVRR